MPVIGRLLARLSRPAIGRSAGGAGKRAVRALRAARPEARDRLTELRARWLMGERPRPVRVVALVLAAAQAALMAAVAVALAAGVVAPGDAAGIGLAGMLALVAASGAWASDGRAGRLLGVLLIAGLGPSLLWACTALSGAGIAAAALGAVLLLVGALAHEPPEERRWRMTARQIDARPRSLIVLHHPSLPDRTILTVVEADGGWCLWIDRPGRPRLWRAGPGREVEALAAALAVRWTRAGWRVREGRGAADGTARLIAAMGIRDWYAEPGHRGIPDPGLLGARFSPSAEEVAASRPVEMLLLPGYWHACWYRRWETGGPFLAVDGFGPLPSAEAISAALRPGTWLLASVDRKGVMLLDLAGEPMAVVPWQERRLLLEEAVEDLRRAGREARMPERLDAAAAARWRADPGAARAAMTDEGLLLRALDAPPDEGTWLILPPPAAGGFGP